jgi:hypothetical protein
LILCPLLAVLIRAPLGRRVALPLLVLAGYAAVVAPWAVRNTRLQGVVTIVDTMGGMNLRMGNYEYTPDDRMWDAVALNGEKSWVHGLSRDFAGQTVTEGQKEKWAQRKALEYMRANPGITLRRALIKFADFWGLEREFAAGVQNGFLRAARVAAGVRLGRDRSRIRDRHRGRCRRHLLAAPGDWRMHVRAAVTGCGHHGRTHDRVRPLAIPPAADADIRGLRGGAFSRRGCRRIASRIGRCLSARR